MQLGGLRIVWLRNIARGTNGMARRRLLLAALFCINAASVAQAEEISGSGSTFAFPVIAAWAEAYQRSTGTHIQYQPIASGAGMTEIQAGIVDFAVSDAPLVDSQLLRDGLMQFPLVIGAIIPVVNLQGIGPAQLHLTGQVRSTFIWARSPAGTTRRLPV
jgi:phosphate transport system substrate-binding protein